MNIKDRGNIKWTSLMLVEHREKLKRLKELDENIDCKKPELSEDELRRLNYVLQVAIKNNKMVKITYYKKKNFHQERGKIEKCRSATRQIILSSGENATEGEKIKLEIDDIVNIEILSEDLK